jgi:hypothetical protein
MDIGSLTVVVNRRYAASPRWSRDTSVRDVRILHGRVLAVQLALAAAVIIASPLSDHVKAQR